MLDPEPPTPAAPAVDFPCPLCAGTGRERIAGSSGRWYVVACEYCDGAGTNTVTDDFGGWGDDLAA